MGLTAQAGWKNRLYFGDNLAILREYVADESVDLIYLDPPFNSNATYNVLFKEKSGEESAAQITAFEDTWHWGLESQAVYQEIVTRGPRQLADLIQALRAFLGCNDMMAYLVMMAIRLVELRRVLKPTGSIYLHAGRQWTPLQVCTRRVRCIGQNCSAITQIDSSRREITSGRSTAITEA
jgi:DNA modification methylase